jgi:hypothetical protein
MLGIKEVSTVRMYKQYKLKKKRAKRNRKRREPTVIIFHSQKAVTATRR